MTTHDGKSKCQQKGCDRFIEAGRPRQVKYCLECARLRDKRSREESTQRQREKRGLARIRFTKNHPKPPTPQVCIICGDPWPTSYDNGCFCKTCTSDNGKTVNEWMHRRDAVLELLGRSALAMRRRKSV